MLSPSLSRAILKTSLATNNTTLYWEIQRNNRFSSSTSNFQPSLLQFRNTILDPRNYFYYNVFVYVLLIVQRKTVWRVYQTPTIPNVVQFFRESNQNPSRSIYTHIHKWNFRWNYFWGFTFQSANLLNFPHLIMWSLPQTRSELRPGSVKVLELSLFRCETKHYN